MSGEDLNFSFIFETKSKIFAKNHSLDNIKTYQESDTPVKIIKDSMIFFFVFLFLHDFNYSIFDVTFPSELKNADAFEKQRPEQC